MLTRFLPMLIAQDADESPLSSGVCNRYNGEKT